MAEKRSWWERNQPKVWRLLDEPKSSRAAKVIALFFDHFSLILLNTLIVGTNQRLHPVYVCANKRKTRHYSSSLKWSR